MDKLIKIYQEIYYF